ncbi:uncharacterized protein LOC126899142 [Daktulosphaira vitifoliae]|uniref:uncharacterized protein LOC126899142 n=1 Tax=Daktulosphaira vitifoliae TaxID=58002 RepID=UPI0021AAAA68|nr:uncharacterized protein LOC126899142 [Daktulosphaira vitifoliae]
MITLNGRPFKSIEDSGFRKVADPLFKAINFIPNAEMIRENLIARAIYIRQLISNEIKDNFFCLKIDSATRHDRNILGINVQYIKNSKIVIRTLAITEIDSSKSVDLKNIVLNVLERYNLKTEKIFSITTDNGANMLKTVTLLKYMECDVEINNQFLIDNESIEKDHDDVVVEEEEEEDDEYEEEEENGSENSVEDDDYNDVLNIVNDDLNIIDYIIGGTNILSGMRCAAHTLQLSILDVLKNNCILKILSKARSIVKILRRPNMQTSLKNLKTKKPPIDCFTRWGSTFNMIEGLLQCQHFCELMAPQNKLIFMNNESWSKLKDLYRALEPAKIACTKLQSEVLTPGDTIAIWKKCILNTKKINNNLSNKIVECMEHRQILLFDSDCFLSALLLDTRYNVLLTNFEIIRAKTHLVNLWKLIENDNFTSTSQVSTLSESFHSDYLELELRQYEKNNTREVLNENQALEDEIEKFLQKPRDKQNESIMDVWDKYKMKYPKLYILSVIVLALPTTQVTVERLFSSVKFILSDQRARLNKNILDDLMVVRQYHLFNKK